MKYSVRTQKSDYDECPLSEKKSRAIGFLASMASRKMEINKIKIIRDEDHDRFLECLSANGELVPLVPRNGALASHHCGTGSTPGPGVICGLSLLLVLVLAPRGFSPGTSVFPLSSKTNICKFQFDRETVDEESPRRRATANSHFKFFIFLFLVASNSTISNNEVIMK